MVPRVEHIVVPSHKRRNAVEISDLFRNRACIYVHDVVHLVKFVPNEYLVLVDDLSYFIVLKVHVLDFSIPVLVGQVPGHIHRIKKINLLGPPHLLIHGHLETVLHRGRQIKTLTVNLFEIHRVLDVEDAENVFVPSIDFILNDLNLLNDIFKLGLLSLAAG